MPPIIGLLTTLAPVLSGVGAAATLGDVIYNATSGGGGGGGGASDQNAAAQAQAQLQAQQADAQKQQAIKAQVANAQERTGGSLTTPGLTDLASILAGYAGQAGGPSPFSPPVTGSSNPSTPGLQDAVSQLSAATPNPVSASFSGGS